MVVGARVGHDADEEEPQPRGAVGREGVEEVLEGEELERDAFESLEDVDRREARVAAELALQGQRIEDELTGRGVRRRQREATAQPAASTAASRVAEDAAPAAAAGRRGWRAAAGGARSGGARRPCGST